MSVVLFVASLALSPGVNAQLFRAYLSLSGNDANACTLQAPCRLLPKALSVTDPGGEVWMLDSANYNTGPVTISKAVTILAVPGALGSLLANNGDAIVVAAISGSITLRNLVITDLFASQHGVHYVSGDSLTIEECEIHGLAGDGIRATAATGSLTVKNSTIRSLGGAGVSVSGTGATLDRVNILRAATGVSASGNARVSIGNSTLNNFSEAGVHASGAGGGFVRVQIIESVIKFSTKTGILVEAPLVGDQASVLIRKSNIMQADVAVHVSAGAGLRRVLLDENMITQVNTAVNVNGATVSTRSNNTLGSSGAGVVGALNPIASF